MSSLPAPSKAIEAGLQRAEVAAAAPSLLVAEMALRPATCSTLPLPARRRTVESAESTKCTSPVPGCTARARGVRGAASHSQPLPVVEALGGVPAPARGCSSCCRGSSALMTCRPVSAMRRGVEGLGGCPSLDPLRSLQARAVGRLLKHTLPAGRVTLPARASLLQLPLSPPATVEITPLPVLTKRSLATSRMYTPLAFTARPRGAHSAAPLAGLPSATTPSPLLLLAVSLQLPASRAVLPL
jgi:hypothetical protein